MKLEFTSPLHHVAVALSPKILLTTIIAHKMYCFERVYTKYKFEIKYEFIKYVKYMLKLSLSNSVP